MPMTKEELSERYLLAVDEINLDTSKPLKEVQDEFLEILINAYLLGVECVNDMLGTNDRADVDEMEEVIFFLIDGETFEDRVRKHYEADNSFATLTDSEFHRVYNGGAEKTAVKHGADKEWLTMMDYKVRDTHSYLEGVTVSVGEDFYTFDGDHAPYPGGFTKAENNANCRCILWYSNHE